MRASATPRANAPETLATLPNQADTTVKDPPRNGLEHGSIHGNSPAPQANVRAGSESHNPNTSLSHTATTHIQGLNCITTPTPHHGVHTEGGTAADVGARPSQAGLNQKSSTGTSRAINEQDKDSPDYGEIVRQLQRLKRERKTQEQEIEAERKALPDTSALQESAEEATAREVELKRLAEEARQKAEVERSKLKDALTQKSRVIALEEQLERLRRSSHSLRLQLEIDD